MFSCLSLLSREGISAWIAGSSNYSNSEKHKKRELHMYLTEATALIATKLYDDWCTKTIPIGVLLKHFSKMAEI